MTWEDRASERIEARMLAENRGNREGIPSRIGALGWALGVLGEEWGNAITVLNDGTGDSETILVAVPGGREYLRLAVTTLSDGNRLIGRVCAGMMTERLYETDPEGEYVLNENDIDAIPWWKWAEIIGRVARYVGAPVVNDVEPGSRLAARRA